MSLLAASTHTPIKRLSFSVKQWVRLSAGVKQWVQQTNCYSLKVQFASYIEGVLLVVLLFCTRWASGCSNGVRSVAVGMPSPFVRHCNCLFVLCLSQTRHPAEISVTTLPIEMKAIWKTRVRYTGSATCRLNRSAFSWSMATLSFIQSTGKTIVLTCCS